MRFRLIGIVLALVCGATRGQDAPAQAGGVFVAVGYGGRRMSSTDGLRWENDQRWSDEAKDDDNVLFNVAFGAGRFIAVGGGAKVGHVLSTRDGREWKELPPWKGRVATIAYGNGRFVAGHDAELLSSSDGEVFTPGQRLDWKGSVHARRSACGDTEAGFRFVIIGDVDLWAERKRVSWRAVTGSGATYEHAALDATAATDIAYGSGHFVAVGPDGLIESSHDGQAWQRHAAEPGQNFSRVVWTGRRFVVSGGQATWSSPDGVTWKKGARGMPCSVAWARDGFLGLGFSWGGNVHTSSDLVEWRKVAVLPGPSLQAVAYGKP